MTLINRAVFSLFCLVIFSVSALGQGTKTEFNKAKSLFDNEQYALAMGQFKPIMSLNEDNDLVRFANFYYGVSAFKSGDAREAKRVFETIKTKYPDWQIKEELDFWIAKINFEEGLASDGFDVLKGINDQSFTNDIVDLKKSYLASVADTVELKDLLLEQEDTLVAKRLLTELLKVPVAYQNHALIQQLIADYEVFPEPDLAGIEFSPKKDVYNVGLFFPFQYQNDSASLVRVMNDWPIKFLEGMELGVEKLAEEGININLMSFDTKVNAAVTKQILEDQKLKGLDFIVGPVYAGPTSEVAKYAKENKVNMLNPISSNSEILIDNPFAFLYYPSNESLAISAAEYTKKHFTKNKKAAIFYSSESDRVRAELYRKLIQKDSFEVVIYEMVRPNESVRIQQMLVEEVEIDKDSAIVVGMIDEMDSLLEAGVEDWKIYEDTDFKEKVLGILTDSIGHIFVASDVPTLSASAISGIDARPDTIYYIGSSRWLTAEQSILFEQLERVDAVFTGSNWIDYDKPSVQEFRERFLAKYASSPRREERLAGVYTGYDIMVTYGRLLHKYGKYFQLALKSKGKEEGELTDGFNYRFTNDNRFIPILKMTDSKIRISDN